MTDASAAHSHEFVVDAELLELFRERGIADDMTVGDRVRLEFIAGDADPFAGFIGAMTLAQISASVPMRSCRMGSGVRDHR